MSLTAAPGAFGQGLNAEVPEPGRTWHASHRLRAALSSDSSAVLLVQAAEMELVLGRAQHAKRILASLNGYPSALPAELVPLAGSIEYAVGEYVRAGTLLGKAVTLAGAAADPALAARAGDAYERAGLPVEAADWYRHAAQLSPALDKWLALRRARVTGDTVAAARLLELVPAEMQQQAFVVWGDLLVAAGDTTSAVSSYTAAELPSRAAMLSLLVGDTADARRLANEALGSDDTVFVREALAVLDSLPGATTTAELLRIARAHRVVGSRRQALRYAERAAADSSATAATVFLGDLLAENSQREAALRAYARAAAAADASARTAAYKRARLLLRMGRVRQGLSALEAFAARYPEDGRAPMALTAAADRRRGQRRIGQADSLLREISRQWPQSGYASQARFRLASSALTRGDTAAAVELYQAEVDVRGAQRRAGRYFLAAIRAARGDSLEARGTWAALAREDSLGYYGTIARAAAGLPPMRFDPSPPRAVSLRAREMLDQVDFLRAAGFREEEDALLAAIEAEPPGSPHEWLDVAEGLIERGRTAEGVRLGWRAASALTLNDPRVVRVIFPWPLRDAIEAEAREFAVDPYLLVALIRQESAFRVDVVSRAGAHGLMQLMPPTARDVARRLGVEWDRSLLHVADANLHLGASHLAGLLKRFEGAVIPALAAYNAGGTPVRRWLRLPEARDPALFVERVPYSETRGYLRTVLRNRALYRSLYPPAEVDTDVPQ